MKSILYVKSIACLVLLLVCSSVWAESDSVWPVRNMKAHWDFTKNHNIDLLHGDALKYNDTKRDDGKYRFVKQLKNGKKAIRSTITFPYSISELDSFTVVLKYSIERVAGYDSINKVYRGDLDPDILDEEIFYLHSKAVLEADDEIIEFWGYTDDSTGTYAITELEIKPDENDEFAVVIAYKKTIPDSRPFVKSNILFGCGTGGKMKYYYTNFKKKNIHFISLETYKDNDKIQVDFGPNSDACLTEIVFYEGLLSSEELAQVMGTEEAKVLLPGDDDSDWWDWRFIPYVALVIFVILMLKVERIPKKYRPITAKYIGRRFGLDNSPEKREEAMGYIAELWKEFGDDKKKPVFPDDQQRVRAIFEQALATGCADKDVLHEYNSLAALINECKKISLHSYVGMLGAISVFLIASAGSFFNRQWAFEVQSNAFIINWVAMAVCMIASLEVVQGTPGERIKNSRMLMGIMTFCSQLLGSVMIGAGAVPSSAILVLVGVVILMLYGFVICVQTVTLVSVSTGRVVGTAVTGVGTGLIFGLVIVYLIVWLLSFVWPYIEWTVVLAIPFIVYKIVRD